MKKKYGALLFSAGVLLLVVQFLILAFRYINGDISNAELIISVESEINFKTFISEFWSGLAGCLLLVYLIVRRITKGPDVMLTLVGVFLWVIQLLRRYESQSVADFVIAYLIGIVGTATVAVAALFDLYAIKGHNPDDDKFGK